MSGQATPVLRRHFWIAGSLSLLLPGLGHFYLGRIRWVSILIGGWVAFAAVLLTPIPLTFAGFAFAYLGMLSVYATACIHAAAVAWRSPFVVRRSYHRWYGYAAYVAVVSAAMTGVTFAVVRIGGYHPFRITSGSMNPTLRPGDYFIAKEGRFDARYVGGAIVYRRDEETHVHRLVAAGGDRVAVRDRQLVINGVTLARRPLCDVQLDMGAGKISEETLGSSRYAVQDLDVAISDRLSERDEEVLAPGQMFVVGDFRDNSADSRFYGASAESQYVGRALYIIWSDDWSRIGRSLSADLAASPKDHCPPGSK